MRRLAFLSLWLFVFTIPWERSLDLGGSLGSIGRVAGFLAFGTVFISVLKDGTMRRLRKFHLFLLGFLFLISLSIFWSADPEETGHTIRLMVQSSWVAWIIWQLCRTPESLRSIRAAFLLGQCTLVALTVQAFLNGSIVQSAKEARFAASGWNWNDMAVTLSLGIPIACEFALASKHIPSRVLGYGTLALSVIGVLLTSSRTGMFGAGVALLALPLLARRTKLSTKFLASLAILLTFLLSLQILPEQTFARLQTTGQEVSSGNMNNRTATWQVGLLAFPSHMFLGVGAGAFKAGTGSFFSPHNTYLQVLIENGMVGFVLYLLILAAVLVALRRLRGSEKVYTGVLFLTYLVCTTVIHWIAMPATWFIFGLIVAESSAERSMVSIRSDHFREVPGNLTPELS